MKIFAHRGDSGDYPENTILAFKKALELNVYGIELDVHKSKDGHLVVIHDEDIQRTFNGKGLVKDFTLTELKKFNCKKIGFAENLECKIPTLREVFELIKDTDITLNIEAKTDLIHYDLEQDVLNLISEYNFKEKVLISSFNYSCIKTFKSLDDTIKYGALYGSEKDYYPETNIVNHAKALGVYSINISKNLVTKEVVDLAHKNGLKVFVYTVNTPISMIKMIECNVDGIFSDYPNTMKDVITKY